MNIIKNGYYRQLSFASLENIDVTFIHGHVIEGFGAQKYTRGKLIILKFLF